MGILREPAEWLADLAGMDSVPSASIEPEKRQAAFKAPALLFAGFSVLELGDQFLTYTPTRILARDFFDMIGCGNYVSLDGNGQNGAFPHDLNLKLDRRALSFPGPFDVVTDFGTGEHVFDQAQVWRTIHGLMPPGGLFVFDRPSQGYPEHCYYRFDECLYRDVAAANGYEIIHLARKIARTYKRLDGLAAQGELIRGIFRRTRASPKHFQIPQQGRYHAILKPIMGGR